MKKCPACDKTFEDSMRFCQADGTPLVDDEPAFDPYATMVGSAGSFPPPSEQAPVETHAEEPGDVSGQTVGSIPIDVPDEILDLPEADPLKTMYVSDAEMKAALGTSGSPDDSGSTSEPEIIELSPVEDTPQPEPPSFSVPDVPPPSFGDTAAPPSPFDPPPSPFGQSAAASEPSFPEPAPAPPVFGEPAPSFDEAATVMQPSYGVSPFDVPTAAPAAAWNPLPAPDASWQNQQIGTNTPFQQPVAGAAGENKTFAIVSLVCGILGLTVCCGSFVVSIVAIVLGVIARNKASQSPNEYGGSGLAMAGIVTGALGLVASLIFIVFYFVIGIASIPLN